MNDAQVYKNSFEHKIVADEAVKKIKMATETTFVNVIIMNSYITIKKKIILSSLILLVMFCDVKRKMSVSKKRPVLK